MDYTLIRSNRKTICIQVRPEGVVVRAPHRAAKAQIDAFVRSKSDWIDRTLQKVQAVSPVEDKLTPEDIRDLANRAMQVIPVRVAHYARLIGVTYGRITIRNQRTRWGSCSAKGNLNFNCLLMLTPPEVVDSVVVHELCHRKEMNHSKAFYAEVLKVFPEYKKWDAWLKQHGRALLCRMDEG